MRSQHHAAEKKVQPGGYEHGLWSQATWVLVPALPLYNQRRISYPPWFQFSHLQNGGNLVPTSEGLKKIKCDAMPEAVERLLSLLVCNVIFTFREVQGLGGGSWIGLQLRMTGGTRAFQKDVWGCPLEVLT